MNDSGLLSINCKNAIYCHTVKDNDLVITTSPPMERPFGSPFK